MVVIDTSNEWNKEGAVLMALKRYPDAESAFLHAAAASPGNPYAYLNLERVYNAMGSPERAQEARTVADALTAGQVQGEQFKEELGK
jgi:tetratricopeptide (TPR) repeat protein